jgi:hypothetical protein
MKNAAPVLRLSIAAALSAFAGLAMAQAPAAPAGSDVPKPSCGELPADMPTRASPDSRKRAFERAMREYGTCIRGYVEERNAAIRAQQKAVQVYIDAYNELLKKYQAERDEEKK